METDEKGVTPHPAPDPEDREGKPVKPGQGQPELPESLPEAYRKLEAERREIYDRLLRKQAELDNTRKRIEREKDEFLQHANSDLLHSLLPTLDGFDRALKHRDPKVPEQFYEGLELIYRELLETLHRAGLSFVETKGLTFDPE
ncbi:MAG: nucleotide exchange factor GrpE, partial [Terriglobia bacterium]